MAELSSFQLETIADFRPWIALWTNLSADHLDRYPNMEAYAEAKARIFHKQTSRDFAVVPARDPWLETHEGRDPGACAAVRLLPRMRSPMCA